MVGEKVQGYEILSMLGAGGFGAVYRAKDIHLGREVAIKVLSNQDRPMNRARFRDEGRLLAKLQHPKIIQVFTVGELEDGSSFLVMELYGKGALNHFFPLGTPADLSQSIALIKDLLSALVVAHQQGIVHRDLKEANLLYDPAYPDQIKLCDFGIARSQEPLSDEAESTADGRIVGTCHYIAPERYRGIKEDPRSDLFSVGVIFYRLLCGHKPFERYPKEKPENIVVMQRVLNENVPSLPAHIPLKIARICYQLLAKSLELRFQSAQEALLALQQAQSLADTQSQSSELPLFYPHADFDSNLKLAEQSTVTFEPLPLSPTAQSTGDQTQKGWSKHSWSQKLFLLLSTILLLFVIALLYPSTPQKIDLSRPAFQQPRSQPFINQSIQKRDEAKINDAQTKGPKPSEEQMLKKTNLNPKNLKGGDDLTVKSERKNDAKLKIKSKDQPPPNQPVMNTSPFITPE